MVPDWTLATHKVAGVKKEKHRITIHHCCNSTGQHKLPMWIIGKSKKPRCFGAARLKSVEGLGITWRANKTAWMVTEIMKEWLLWFDRQMKGRKVILLLDNFSAHECAVAELEVLPQGSGLLHTEICWLPPRTTSKLQPLDQGIIASFKAQYRRRWISYILAEHELFRNAVDTVNVLKAIQWSIAAWDDIAATTIANCWAHSTVNLEPVTTPLQPDEAYRELQIDLDNLEQQQRIRQIMNVEQLLNLPEEQVVDSPEDLDNHLVELFSPVEDEESDTEILEPLPQMTPEHCIQLLEGLKLGEMQSDDCNAEFIRWMNAYEKVIRKRRIGALKQVGIGRYFNTIASQVTLDDAPRDHPS